MPLYTYRCARGHQFDALVKLDGSNAPKTCEVVTDATPREVLNICDQPVEKVIAVNAKLFPGADSWRK